VRHALRIHGWAEPAAIFALIMLHIWWIRARAPGFWAAILVLVIASHILRRERPSELGFGAAGLRGSADAIGPFLALAVVALAACGLLAGSFRPLTGAQALAALAWYLPWGLFQQYLLNGYFARRFRAAANPRRAALIAAALFGLAHLPNWFLAPVTFLGGWAAARFYVRHPNLYPLGLAHGVIGFLLYWVVPDWISGHLNVGPGWFRVMRGPQ
jgi:membrane protease YdiL (CAAX protease family)